MQIDRLWQSQLRQVLSLSIMMFFRFSSVRNSLWNLSSRICSSLSPVFLYSAMDIPLLRLLYALCSCSKGLEMKEVKQMEPWLVQTMMTSDSKWRSLLKLLMSHLGILMSEYPKSVLELKLEVKFKQCSQIFNFPWMRIIPSLSAQWNSSMSLGPSSSSSLRTSPQHVAFILAFFSLPQKPVKVIIFCILLALRWLLNFLRCTFSTKTVLSILLRKKGMMMISQYFFSKRLLLRLRFSLFYSRIWSYMQQCPYIRVWIQIIRYWQRTLYSLWLEQNFYQFCLYYNLRSIEKPFLRSAQAKWLVSYTNLSKLNPRYFLSQASTLVLPNTLVSLRTMDLKKEIQLMMMSISFMDSAGSISDMMSFSEMKFSYSFSNLMESMFLPVFSISDWNTFIRSYKISSTSKHFSNSLMISLRICTMVLSFIFSERLEMGSSITVEYASQLSSSMMG